MAIKNFREYLNNYKQQRTIRYLKNISPEKIEKISETAVVESFHRLVSISAAYRDFLQKNNIKPDKIRNISDFTNEVPILNKDNFFRSYSVDKMLGENLSNLKLTMSSSGYSGTFAFGFSSQRSLNKNKIGIDTTLNYWFDISHKRTFLINCMPMGVHVDTSLPIAETSVRSDVALELLKNLSRFYDQTIIVGDPYFLKKLIEEGCAEGIKWKSLNISLITGQDWLPESLRTYLLQLIDLDPETEEERGFYATMGMTELGLNVFHESKTTVRLRRTVLKNPELKARLSPDPMKACPNFFHYYPFRTYIETIKNGGRKELLFSVTDARSLLPLIRYSTGDAGNILKFSDLELLLSKDYPGLVPDLKLPLGLMYGRSKNLLRYDDHEMYLEDVREGLFSDREVASSVTGLIRLAYEKDIPQVDVQLNKNFHKNKNLEERIRRAIHSYLPVEIYVNTLSYFEFPGGTELSYERKLSIPPLTGN